MKKDELLICLSDYEVELLENLLPLETGEEYYKNVEDYYELTCMEDKLLKVEEEEDYSEELAHTYVYFVNPLNDEKYYIYYTRGMENFDWSDYKDFISITRVPQVYYEEKEEPKIPVKEAYKLATNIVEFVDIDISTPKEDRVEIITEELLNLPAGSVLADILVDLIDRIETY